MKSKQKQKGGGCTSYAIIGEIAPGIPKYGPFKYDCQGGGAKKRARSVKRKRGKRGSKKKVDEKKVGIIIEKLCKSMKRRCTPKYKKLLKEIVIKNM